MSDTFFQLLRLLADGHFHSGQSLAESLGISRAAVSKSLQRLVKQPHLGLVLHAVNGRGYRLSSTLDLLSTEKITRLISPQSDMLLKQLEVYDSLDSTNSYLKTAAEQTAPSGSVVIAEYQSEGRGRHGRQWFSPYGTNIYCSLLWRFPDGMAGLGALGLAVAAVLLRAFKQGGAEGLGIKWPNDILLGKRKLAGILIDAAGETNGSCYAVIGVGVNYDMPEYCGGNIGQPWANLRETGFRSGRNELVAAMLEHLLPAIDLFQQQGFTPFRDEWRVSDLLYGQPIVLQLPSGTTNGVAMGIDESGLLCVQNDGKIRRYAAGDVTLQKS